MFWSIRTKFLSVFILSVLLTLVVTFCISYTSIETAYMRINDRSTYAEFQQIAGEITMLLEDADLLLSSRIINLDAARELAGYRKLSVPELSYAVRILSGEVINLASTYEYIDSVYVHVADEWILAMSRLNTQQIYDARQKYPSERIMKLLSEADYTASVAGYVRDADFPLDMKETAYLMLYKKAYTVSGNSTFCMNIKENVICEKYAGFTEENERRIRVLDREGRIVSSTDKGEIGQKLAILENEDITKRGMLEADGIVTNYMPMEQYGLVIVSSIPASVYTSDLDLIRNRMIQIFALGMMVISLLFAFWIERKLKPLTGLREGMKNAGRGDYSHQLPVEGNDELSELIQNYNSMLTDLQKLTEQRKQTEIELRERELAVLRNEINPHFLYNTLNTIKCMADLEGNAEIARCIMALGGIIAPLYKVNTPTWMLREEVKISVRYLEIMNIRYGNGIIYEQDIPEELLDKQVMRFILQPILENSILHGFEEQGYIGYILLTVREESEGLQIIVEDDGKGMSDEALEHLNIALNAGDEAGGVGILNVSRRIKLRYGAGYGMILKPSVYGGLRTEIELPG